MSFKKGRSGNPSGRPKGITDKRAEYRNLLEFHARELIERLVTMAKDGDPTALKLCIERLIPKAKPDDSICIDLPTGPLNSGASMLQIAGALTVAVITGQLSLEEGERLSTFIDHQRTTINAGLRQMDREGLEQEIDQIFSKKALGC